MRKIAAFLLLAVIPAIYLSGCAMVASPLTGGIVTNVKGPVTATGSDQVPTKVGQATATSVLGWVASGDASIEAAAKAGGITKIHHVDYQSNSVLGIYAKYTVIVYGN